MYKISETFAEYSRDQRKLLEEIKKLMNEKSKREKENE